MWQRLRDRRFFSPSSPPPPHPWSNTNMLVEISLLGTQARQTSGFTWRGGLGHSTTQCFKGPSLPSPSCMFSMTLQKILSFVDYKQIFSVYPSPPTPPLPSSCPTGTRPAGTSPSQRLTMIVAVQPDSEDCG